MRNQITRSITGGNLPGEGQSTEEEPESREPEAREGEGDGSHTRYFINSLAKGFDVLSCFKEGRQAHNLTEMAEMLGWNKPTTFRFAYTLQRLGYLQQDPETKKYRLGVRVLELGFGFLSGLELPDLALPHMKDLSRLTGESVNLAILDGPDIIYVARVPTNRITVVNLHVGTRLPAYCTSMGKVLLASLPWDQVKKTMARVKLVKHTPNTVGSLDEMKKSLDLIRELGYAITDQELEMGVRSAAAPVRNATGTVVASVNISTAAAQVSLDDLVDRMVPPLLKCAEAISSSLGYIPRPR